MIVSDEEIEAALGYLNIDPHPLAEAEWNLTTAKNERERLFAELYQTAEGTVRDRECWVECNQAYQATRRAEAECVRVVVQHKARTRWAETITDLWRTSQANARAAERVR